MKKNQLGAMIMSFLLATSFARPLSISADEKELDLNEIKKNADEIMEERYKSSVVYDGEKDIFTTAEGEVYSKGDKVRIIVELESNEERSTFKENSRIQQKVINEIEEESLNFDLRYVFAEDKSYLSAITKVEDIADISSMENVKSVRIAKTYKANLGTANSMIQGNEVWNDLGFEGEGMTVAVLDTGFEIDHPDFILSEEGKENAKLTEEKISEKLKETVIDDIYYNEKFPTGYDWADMDNDVLPADLVSYNHGMHVAGIISANGNVEEGGVKGIAPESQIIAEKVFGDNSGTAYEDDIAKGIFHAIEMGADIISMSLGSDAGIISEDDLVQCAIKEATEKGILVVVAAGNAYYQLMSYRENIGNPYAEYYDQGVVGDPGVSPYALTVASVNNCSKTANIANLSNGQDIKYMNQAGFYEPVTNVLGSDSYELVYASTGSDNEFKAIEAEGKIAVIDCEDIRNVTFFKQLTALNYGAKGIIAIGNLEDNLQIKTYLPIVTILREDGEKIIESLQAGESIAVQFTDKTVNIDESENVTLSDFSSWGLCDDLSLKPEIAGVGGNIYSTTPDGKHINMSGTSMSTPQVAGAAALLIQSLKNEGLEVDYSLIMDVKNILMNNTELILNEEEIPYSARKQGAGLLQIKNAIESTVVAYDANANLERKGAIELKEIGNEINFNVALKSLKNESEEFNVYIDLYTDQLSTDEIDNNLDGTVDTVKTVNLMKSRKLNGAVIKINGEEINENGYNININDNTIEELKVTIDLSSSDIVEQNYLDGFIRIVSAENEEKIINLPLVGFYGQWDKGSNTEYPINSGEQIFFSTGVWETDTDVPMGLDTLSNQFNPQKVAISKYGIDSYVGLKVSVLRNLQYLAIDVRNEAGDIVKDFGYFSTNPSEPMAISKNTYYNDNINYSIVDYDGYSWDGTDEENNFVEDGLYKFVLKTKLNYDEAEEQQVEFPIYVDSYGPEVNNLKVIPKDDKYEISFEVDDELTGYYGAILYVDDEYIELNAYETSYIVDKLPENVVVMAYDHARNCRIQPLGDSNIPLEAILIYYNAYGEYVNYENPAYLQYFAQEVVKWNLELYGPTGMKIENIVSDYLGYNIYEEWYPEEGWPEGTYTLKGTIEDQHGLSLELPESEINIVDNNSINKDKLLEEIIKAEALLNSSLIGDEPGQYPEASAKELAEAIMTANTNYYSTTIDEIGVLEATTILIEAENKFMESKIPAATREDAEALVQYVNELIENSEVGDRPGQYPEDEMSKLVEEKENMETLLSSDEEITPKEWTEAVEKLNKAVKMFLDSEIKAADVKEIENSLLMEREYIAMVESGASEDKYTKESIEEIKALLDQIEKEIEVPLREEEVENIKVRLEEGINKFRDSKLDLTNLKDTIKEAESFYEQVKDEKGYDIEKIANLENTIKEAKELLKATDLNDEIINSEIKKVKDAVKAVKDSKVNDDSLEDDNKDNNLNNSGSNSNHNDSDNINNSNGNNSSSIDNNRKNDKINEIPKTGDNISYINNLLASIMILSIGIYEVRKRKKVI